MNDIKIEIAGGEIDLAKGVGFGLNFAIDDIRKIESKNSNYSKTITLAGSKNNNKLLGGLFDINAEFTFFNPNFKTEARIIVNSSTVIDGFLQLKSIEKQTDNQLDGNLIVYKCVISSKTIDFLTEIKDKKLNELDFNEFNTGYLKDDVVATWSNTYKEGFVFPMPYTKSNDFNTADFKPAIFHKAYLKRIAFESGFNLSGSLMDDSTDEGGHYAKEIIPFTGDIPDILTEEQEIERTFDTTLILDDDLVTKTISGQDNPYSNAYQTIIFDKDNDTRFNTPALINYTTGQYTVIDSGGYSIYGFIGLELEYTTAATEAFQQVREYDDNGVLVSDTANADYNFTILTTLFKNGVVFGASTRTAKLSPTGGAGLSTFNSGNSYTVNDNFSLRTNNYVNYLQAGDVIDIQIEVLDVETNVLRYTTALNSGSAVDVDFTLRVANTSSFKNDPLAVGTPNNGFVVLNAWIPTEIKQVDLITDLVKRYNAYISVDPDNDRNIIIDTREKYYAKGGTLDWSDKKDNNSKTDIKLLSELQNKEFQFTYKKTTDKINEAYTSSTIGDTYGVKKIEFDNEFVSGIKKIETPFSPTPLVYNSTNPIAIVSAIHTTVATQEDAGDGFRVLYYGGLKPCIGDGAFTFYFNDWYRYGGDDKETYTDYPYAGHYDDPINPTIDINFGTPLENWGYDAAESTTNANLYNRFWGNYIQQINTGKIVTMSMNLDEVDISYIRHNLNTKIYVNDSYYYINKIVDYNPLIKGVTKVEFLKINEGVSFVSEITSTSPTIRKENGNPSTLQKSSGTSAIGLTYSDYTETTGVSNVIGKNSNFSTITGHNNIIGDNSPNATVNGNNNIVDSGISNAVIIGANGKTITQNNESWIGEVHTINGLVVNPPITEVELQIGDWDMDTTVAIDVSHNLSATEWKTIRNVNVMIRNDADSSHYNLDRGSGFGDGGSMTVINATIIQVARVTGGIYDNINYDSTSYNRGWITFSYTPD